MSRTPIVLVSTLVLAACSGGSNNEEAAGGSSADTVALSRAKKDSVIAGSRLPGAGAVGRAMDAAGTAAARTRAMDSIQRPRE